MKVHLGWMNHSPGWQLILIAQLGLCSHVTFFHPPVQSRINMVRIDIIAFFMIVEESIHYFEVMITGLRFVHCFHQIEVFLS